MNAKERAEKLINDVKRVLCCEGDEDDLIAWIAAQIDEADAEAYAKGALDQQRKCAKHCEQQRAEGFRAAREQAATIAETELFRIGAPSHLCSGGEKIAKAIRQMEEP